MPVILSISIMGTLDAITGADIYAMIVTIAVIISVATKYPITEIRKY